MNNFLCHDINIYVAKEAKNEFATIMEKPFESCSLVFINFISLTVQMCIIICSETLSKSVTNVQCRKKLVDNCTTTPYVLSTRYRLC